VAGDSVAPEAVVPLLQGRFGRPYAYLPRCESTQRELAPGAPEGAVVVTDEQTAGRGRLGRPWFAPPRTSVLLSLNLRPVVETRRLPELSVVAGEACAAAIEQVTGLRPTVKLPNDLLVGGRKLAGILAEAREDRVVLGIGVNVNIPGDELPQEVETPATSLLVELRRPIERAPLVAAILARLEEHYDRWSGSVGR
jgi:BirA family biotin operon repressor/biotin-[acetyl-CoA-carboxylase] ligase